MFTSLSYEDNVSSLRCIFYTIDKGGTLVLNLWSFDSKVEVGREEDYFYLDQNAKINPKKHCKFQWIYLLFKRGKLSQNVKGNFFSFSTTTLKRHNMNQGIMFDGNWYNICCVTLYLFTTFYISFKIKEK